MSRKKKVIFSILCVVVVIVATVAILFSVGAQGTTESTLPENTVNICLTPPDDGSLPEDHSVTDNVGYIIGRLSRRTFYHTDSEADVSSNSMGMDVRQTILGTKDFKDGVMITSQLSISYSAFAPSKALQKFFGENSVVVRNAASGNSADWNGRDTEWDAGEPGAIYTNEQYLQVYGLPATEISDFIINEETIVSESEITYDAETQLYSLTVGLDTLTSVAYYVNNMRTMGNLPTNPEFTNVSITFRFLEDWSVVSMEIVEEYSVSMSLAITATTKGVTEVNFSYDEADVDVSDYEEYFSKYANAAPMGGEEQGMTAQDYFLNGFSSVLSGRSVFKVDATVAGEPVTGFILLDMEMGDSIAINELKVQLGGLALAYEGDALYVQYKDLTGKLAVSDITSLLGGLLGGAESGSEEGGGLNADELLGALLGGELTETDTSATLTSTLPLGSLQIPVEFGFDVTETESGKQVAWSYIDVSLEAAGMEIVLNVTPAAESDGNFAEIDTDKAVDLAAYVRDIQALIAGKDYALTLGYAADGLSLDADLRLALADGIALTGTLNVTVGSVSLPLSVTLAEDTVWLSLYGVKISATFDELEEAVAKIVALAGVELPDLGNTEVDVAALVAQLLRIDYDSLIKELSLTGSELSLTVNADELLSALLGSDVTLGELSACYTMGKGFSFEAFGAELGFAASADTTAILPPEDADAYVTLSEILPFVDAIGAIADAKDIAFELSDLTVTVEGQELQFGLQGEVWLADEGVYLWLAFTYADETIQIYYNNDEVQIVYAGYKMHVPASDLELFRNEIGKLLGDVSGEVADADASAFMSLLSELDLQALIESVELAAEEGGLRFAADIASLIGAQESTPLSVSLGADASSLSIELNGGITLFGVTVNSFGASVRTAENALPQLAGTDCKNVFAFILNAYSEFTGSEYMTMTVTLTSPFTATLAGAVQFEKSAEEGDSTVTLNMAFDAVFTDANNENHYIGITIYRDTVYLYYSMIGFAESHYFTPTDDANLDPLRVSLSVSALFDAAQTVLPIVTPLLGLEDSAAYYFDFVYEILGGAYTTINSDIFSVMNTQEWLELVLGIIDEHTGSGAETSAQDAGASQAAEIAFDLGELKLSVSMNGVAIDIAAGSAYYNAENALSAPTDGAYTDISWISQLMQDVLTAYDYYEDGRGYYLSGSLGIDVIGIELDLTIGFELRIGFDEANAPYIYIRLTAAEYSNGLLALIPNLWSSTVIPCDTSTEIVVYGGDVYIARTTADSVKSETVSVKFNKQQQEDYWFSKRTYNYYDVTTRSYYTEYRAMTSDSFFADIMDQLIWAVNIDSKLATFIMDMIPAEGESGGTVTRTDDINDMVNSYSGNESGYSVTLDLGKILMEDMLGAVSLNITRTQRADGKYDLTSASLEMTLASVITVKTKDGGITNHIMAEGETSQAEEYCKQIMDTVSSAGAAVPDTGYAVFFGNYTDAVASGQRYWANEDPYYTLFGSTADNVGQTYSYTLTGGVPQYIVS